MRSLRLRYTQPRGTHCYLLRQTPRLSQRLTPATSIVADARGDSSRKVNPTLVVDYECESDEMADSGRLEQSPGRHRATDYEPSTEKVQSNRRVTSLFKSGDKDKPPSPVQSPKPPSAFISVRDGDDDVSNRGKVLVAHLLQWVSLRGVLRDYSSQKILFSHCDQTIWV